MAAAVRSNPLTYVLGLQEASSGKKGRFNSGSRHYAGAADLTTVQTVYLRKKLMWIYRTVSDNEMCII